MDKLDLICIRAQDTDGKFGSFTLREMIDRGRPGIVFGWIIGKLSGSTEEEVITEEMIVKLLDLIPEEEIAMLKKPFSELH